MKKFIAVSILFVLCALPRNTQAFSSFLSSFNTKYGTSSTKLNSCLLCHDTSPAGASWNSYGNDVFNRAVNLGEPIATALANIESLDSDGDGFSNVTEINARTWPGNPADFPVTSTPTIGVTPASLAFGNVRLGTNAVLSVTVTNTGTAILSLTNLTLTGTAELTLTNTPALPINISPGASAKLNVRYTPTNTGADTGNLAILNNDPLRSTVNIPITATGIAPAITVNPAALNFGSTVQGQTTNLTITLGNTGSADCHITALNKTGSTDFSFGPSSPVPPFTITPGSTILVPIAYTASNIGADTGTLTIISDAANTPTVNVPMTGNGNPIPATVNITVTPTSLAFGNLRVGQTATLTATVSNTGGATGTVSALNITSADFALGTTPSTPFNIAPGASTIIPVRYNPTALGNAIGNLAITSNDTNHPTINVALTGTGTQPHIVVTPLIANFGTITIGGNATLTINVANSGTAGLNVTNISLTASSEYTYITGTPVPPFLINPGASTNITIRYTPVDTTTDTGTLAIGSDDPSTPNVTVNLTAAGQLPAPVPVVNVTPLALNFGDIRVSQSGTLTVTINNTGGATAHITPSLTGSADFAASTTAFDIAAGTSQNFTVQYTPATIGADTGSLLLTSNDPSNAVTTVTLTGRGVQSALSLNPISVNFGSVITNGTVTSLITIQNTGSASAQVSQLKLTGNSAFTLGAAAPVPPFLVAGGASVDVPVNFQPTAISTVTGSLDVTSDDLSHPLLSAALTGTGVSGVTAVDFDIVQFRATRYYRLGSSTDPLQIRVKFISRTKKTAASRTATVVGVQNGVEIYRASQSATTSAKIKGGALLFPPYTPTVAGTIQWTATIEDEDPDTDISTTTTDVIAPKPPEGDGGDDDSDR